MRDLPFSFDKAEDSPGFLLWQATLIWQRLIKKALEPYDVSHAQFVILVTLLWFEAHDDESTQIAIVGFSKLDKMTVSQSIKKLLSMELVTRVEHRSDTRAKSVSLNDKGKALIYQLVPIVESLDAKFFGKASKTNQKSLVSILRQLTTGSHHA